MAITWEQENGSYVGISEDQVTKIMITGVTSEEGLTDDGTTITVSAASLGTENVSIETYTKAPADDEFPDETDPTPTYTLALGSVVTTPTYAWTVSGTTATCTKTPPTTYALSDDHNITATKGSTDDSFLTLSGIKEGTAASVFTAPTADSRTIVVPTVALDKADVSLAGTGAADFTLALGTGVTASTLGNQKKFFDDGNNNGVVELRQLYTEGYVVDAENAKVIYRDGATEGEVLATIGTLKTGISDYNTVLSLNGKVITVSEGALAVPELPVDSADVSVTGEGYSLALDLTTYREEHQEWVFDAAGNATYQTVIMSKYYIEDGDIVCDSEYVYVDENNRKIEAADPKTTTVLAKLSGVNSNAGETNFTVENGVIYLDEYALDSKNVTFTSNPNSYTLALSGVNAPTTDLRDPKFFYVTGGVEFRALYSEGYTVGSDGSQITYHTGSDSTGIALATISGIKAGLSEEQLNEYITNEQIYAQDTIVVGLSALDGKNVTFTMGGSDYDFSIAGVSTTDKEWVVREGEDTDDPYEAHYRKVAKSNYYLTNSDTITYSASAVYVNSSDSKVTAEDADTLDSTVVYATITGVSSAAKATDFVIDNDTQYVSIKDGALNNEDLVLTVDDDVNDNPLSGYAIGVDNDDKSSTGDESVFVYVDHDNDAETPDVIEFRYRKLEGYESSVGGTSIYYHDGFAGTSLAWIDGLKPGLTTMSNGALSSDLISETSGDIEINDTSLLNSKDVKFIGTPRAISDELETDEIETTGTTYNLTFPEGGYSTVKEWTVGGGTAIYREVTKSHYYLETASSIKYSEELVYIDSNSLSQIKPTDDDFYSAAGVSILAQIDGVSSGASVADFKITDKVITVSDNALVKAEDTVAELTAGGGSTGYKLALDSDVTQTTVGEKVFVYDETDSSEVEYRLLDNQGYSLSGASYIVYHDGTTGKELAQISGLSEGLSATALNAMVSESAGVITVKFGALNESYVEFTAGGKSYSLALDRYVDRVGDNEAYWTFDKDDKTIAHYQIDTTTNYSLSGESNGNSIVYDNGGASGTPYVYATVGGLNAKLKDYINAAVSATTYDSVSEALGNILVVGTDSMGTESTADDRLTITVNKEAFGGVDVTVAGNVKVNPLPDLDPATKSTKITLTDGSDENGEVKDYMLLAGESVNEPVEKWSLDGTNAVFTQIIPFQFEHGIKTVNKKKVEDEDTLVTNTKSVTTKTPVKISGLNPAVKNYADSEYLADGEVFYLDSESGTINLSPSALGTTNIKLELKAGADGEKPDLKFVDGGYSSLMEDQDIWVVSKGTAKFYAASSIATLPTYTVTDTQITYKAPTIRKEGKVEDQPLITIAGLNSTVAQNAMGYVEGINNTYWDEDNLAWVPTNIVSVSPDLFGTTNITIGGETTVEGETVDYRFGYLYYDADYPTPEDPDNPTEEEKAAIDVYNAAEEAFDAKYHNSFDEDVKVDAAADAKGNVTIKQTIKPGFTLGSNSKAIFYNKKTSDETITLATIKGLSAGASSSSYEIDAWDGVLTLHSGALANKNVTIDSKVAGFTLDLNIPKAEMAITSVSSTESEDENEWYFDSKKKTATYRLTTTAGYAVSDDGKTVTYAKADTYQNLLTIGGIHERLDETIREYLASATGLSYVDPAGMSYAGLSSDDNYKGFYEEAQTAIAAAASIADDYEKSVAIADAKYDALLAAKDTYKEKYADALGNYISLGTESGITTVTFRSAKALGAGAVTVSAGCSIVLDESIRTEAAEEADDMWVVSGNTATLQKFTPAYYTPVEDRNGNVTKLNYKAAVAEKGSKPELKITGLASNLPLDDTTGVPKGLSIAEGVITVSEDALGSATIKIAAGTDYTLALEDVAKYGTGNTLKLAAEAKTAAAEATEDADAKAALVAEATELTTQLKGEFAWAAGKSGQFMINQTKEGYELSDDGKTLTYFKDGTKPATVATVTGINGSLSAGVISGIEFDPIDKVITISDKNILKNVTGKGTVKVAGNGGYTFELSGNAQDTSTPSWVVDTKKKTVVYRKTMAADGYELSADGKTITAVAKGAAVDLITLSGLNYDWVQLAADVKAAGASGTAASVTAIENALNAEGGPITIADDVVTLSESILGTSKVTLKGNYKLALADGISDKAGSETNAWIISGTNATYQVVNSLPYYTIDAKTSTTITYNASKAKEKNKETISLTGLKAGLVVGTNGKIYDTSRAEVMTEDNGTITFHAGALGTKNITVKKGDVTFALDDDVVTGDEAKKDPVWTLKGTTATYTQAKDISYSVGEDKNDKPVVLYSPAVKALTLATVKGLVTGVTQADLDGVIDKDKSTEDNTVYSTAPGIVVDGTAKTITIKAALLQKKASDSDNYIYAKTVSLTNGTQYDGEKNKTKSTYQLVVDPDNNALNGLNSAGNADLNWYTTVAEDKKTPIAQYIACLTPNHFATVATVVDKKEGTTMNLTIARKETKEPQAEAKATVTISGIKKGVDLEGKVTINTSSKTITLNDATIFDNKTAPTVDGGYKFAFGEKLTQDDGFYTKGTLIGWTTKGVNATLTDKTPVENTTNPKGYVLDATAGTITYYAKEKATILATVGGLVKDTKLTYTEGTIDLTKAQLGAKVSVDGKGKTFAFNFTSTDYKGTVTASANADTLTFAGTESTINLGKGNDTITVSGTSNTIKGDAGKDTITISGTKNTVDAGNDDDTITVSGAGNTINAGAGADTINLSAAGNTVIGGAGDDTIDAGSKAFTLQYTTNKDGNDTINNFSSGTIQLMSVASEAKAKNAFEVTTSGGDTVITVGKGKITLKSFTDKSKITIKAKNGDTLDIPDASSGMVNYEPESIAATNDLLRSNNYATGSDLSDITGGNLNDYSVNNIETDDPADITKTTPILTASDK